MHTPQAMLIGIVVVTLAAGCTNDDDRASGPSRTTTTIDAATGTSESTTTVVAAARPIAAFGAGRRETPDFPNGPGPTALLTDVRIGVHDGFDRVVFTFRNRLPGYRVEPVEPPIQEDASGEEIEVAGAAFVAVRMSLASGVDFSGPEYRETYVGPRRLAGPGHLVEVVRTGDFEALLTWVIGTRTDGVFAVATLDSPPRLVVDVAAAA